MSGSAWSSSASPSRAPARASASSSCGPARARTSRATPSTSTAWSSCKARTTRPSAAASRSPATARPSPASPPRSASTRSSGCRRPRPASRARRCATSTSSSATRRGRGAGRSAPTTTRSWSGSGAAAPSWPWAGPSRSPTGACASGRRARPRPASRPPRWRPDVGHRDARAEHARPPAAHARLPPAAAGLRGPRRLPGAGPRARPRRAAVDAGRQAGAGRRPAADPGPRRGRAQERRPARQADAGQRLRLLVRPVPGRGAGPRPPQGGGRDDPGHRLQGPAGRRDGLAQGLGRPLRQGRHRPQRCDRDRLGRLRRAGDLRPRSRRARGLQVRRAAPAAGRGADAEAAAGQAGAAVKARLALLLHLLLAAPALAAVAPDEMLPDPTQEARARALSRELRCLVCQNESIDDSNADLAADLRRLVRQRVAAGDGDEQLKRYLVARYGEFVLLKPPVEPATYLLWLGPPTVLLLGAGLIAAHYRSRRRQPERPVELSPEERARLDRLLAEPEGGSS